MDTAAISYRVADFLKEHRPFQAMSMEDLREFALLGRVKFFEPHQFILTQGASRFDVFVIQQGTVLLWDEQHTETRLFDVRGAGAILGIDESNRARSYPYSARSDSDVLLYSFPADEFDALVEKYPEAIEYVSAYRRTNVDSKAKDQYHLQTALLRDLAATKELLSCTADVSIRDAAQLLVKSKADVLVVLGAQNQAAALLTPGFFAEWVANGGEDSKRPVGAVLSQPAVTMSGEASVVDGVLAAAAASTSALAITSDGSSRGRVQGALTARELGSIFGDRPLEILADIGLAKNLNALKDANRRARFLVQRYLTSATSSEWLSAFMSLVDKHIISRIVAMTAPEDSLSCWCFSGPAGRAESLTSLAPGIVVLVEDDREESRLLDVLRRVQGSIEECGYLRAADNTFDSEFCVARMSVWNRRFMDWISDPIRKEIYLARPFFDLRPVAGNESLWHQLQAQVMSAVNRDFLHIAANDCLATLPPLTFFQNAVVDESGTETTVFRLEETALRPLVDVARVFGFAAKNVFGRSTLERFTMASTLLPGQSDIFKEASDTFRMVLWQQGRVGLAQGSSGAELPPSLLGAYDRQVLRSGFRSILRLLEFVDDLEWLKRL